MSNICVDLKTSQGALKVQLTYWKRFWKTHEVEPDRQTDTYFIDKEKSLQTYLL